MIAIGNPGSGKSSILNSLAEEYVFKSGSNISGLGVTFQLDERKSSKTGAIFLDTPGLADLEMKKQAAEAISKGLRKGGKFKILFFLNLFRGRIDAQDLTTLCMVLKAASEIKENYGIIANMTPKNLLEKLKADKSEFLQSLFNSIPKEMSCSESNILFIAKHPDLEDKDDAFVSSESLETIDSILLSDFVNNNVPEICLHKDKVDDINTDHYQQAMLEMEKRMREVRLQLKDEEEKLKSAQIAMQMQRQKEVDEKVRLETEAKAKAEAEVIEMENMEVQNKLKSGEEKFQVALQNQRLKKVEENVKMEAEAKAKAGEKAQIAMQNQRQGGKGGAIPKGNFDYK